MSWNYRILRYQDGHLALHEVYYDDAGKPNLYTQDAISFAVDEEVGAEGIVDALERALSDAKNRSVIDVSEFGETA